MQAITANVSLSKCPILQIVYLWEHKLRTEETFSRSMENVISQQAISEHLVSQCNGDCAAFVPLKLRGLVGLPS
jgi:hypothetical protein